jgi:hypothetical protein
MAFSATFVVKNLDNIQKKLPFWISLWRIRTRRSLTLWGRDLTILAAALSPQDKLRGIDPRRRSASEGLANKWRWELRSDGLDTVLNVGNIDERMENILFPTKGNPKITSKGDYPLKFYDHRLGGPFFKWSVRRKSLPGQPVHLWTLDRFNVDQRTAELAQDIVANT